MKTDTKRTGGATITNAKRRERGLVRVCVWLSAEDVARLDSIADDRANAIRRCVRFWRPESPARVLGFDVVKGPDGRPRLRRAR